MPNIDPVVRFWVGIIGTIAIAISQGALNLTHLVPTDTIPIVTAWCGAIAFVISAVLTALNGGATTASSRVASAASLPGVKRIDVTPEVAAQVTPETHRDTQIVTVAK